MCKVSVIVPNYNYERYLPERIDSILNQTYTDFELILLDDASTDGSAVLLEKYRDNPHVTHIVINEKNSGSPFRQWMKGIVLARGEWVWIAEADDLCEPTFLETCMARIEATAGIGICYTDSQYIDRDGKNISFPTYKPSTKDVILFDGKKYVEHYLYWDNAIANASSALFKREYAIKLKDHFFQTMRYCGDWIFWIEIAMQGNVLNISQKLNYFRQHHSQTAKGAKLGLAQSEVLMTSKYVETIFPSIPMRKRRFQYGRVSRNLRHIKIKEIKRNNFKAYRNIVNQSLTFNYYSFKLCLHFKSHSWVITNEKDCKNAIISEA